MLADRLLCRPSVQLLSSPVPVRNDIAHITDKNGVVREIQQASLLRSLGDFLLELISGLQKLLLNAAPNRAEPGKQRRKHYENNVLRDFRTFDVKGVEGLCEEVIVGQAREHDCQTPRPWPCIPDGQGDGKQEKREFHLAEVVSFK